MTTKNVSRHGQMPPRRGAQNHPWINHWSRAKVSSAKNECVPQSKRSLWSEVPREGFVWGLAEVRKEDILSGRIHVNTKWGGKSKYTVFRIITTVTTLIHLLCSKPCTNDGNYILNLPKSPMRQVLFISAREKRKLSLWGIKPHAGSHR